MTDVEPESRDDDKESNDGGDFLRSDRWLSSPVLCCAVCGDGIPLFCVCLAVPDSSETLNCLLLDWSVTYDCRFPGFKSVSAQYRTVVTTNCVPVILMFVSQLQRTSRRTQFVARKTD